MMGRGWFGLMPTFALQKTPKKTKVQSEDPWMFMWHSMQLSMKQDSYRHTLCDMLNILYETNTSAQSNITEADKESCDELPSWVIVTRINELQMDTDVNRCNNATTLAKAAAPAHQYNMWITSTNLNMICKKWQINRSSTCSTIRKLNLL